MCVCTLDIVEIPLDLLFTQAPLRQPMELNWLILLICFFQILLICQINYSAIQASTIISVEAILKGIRCNNEHKTILQKYQADVEKPPTCYLLTHFYLRLSADMHRVHSMQTLREPSVFAVSNPHSVTVFILFNPPGGLYAVHQHSRALSGGHELQSSPTVRLHQVVSGRQLRRELRHNAAGKMHRLTEHSRSLIFSSIQSTGCHYSSPETATTEKQLIMAFPLLQKRICQICKCCTP